MKNCRGAFVIDGDVLVSRDMNGVVLYGRERGIRLGWAGKP